MSEFGALLPARSIEDILAERIRLVIGGVVYDLPVLPIRESRVWKDRMDLEFGVLLARVAENDDMATILGLFDGSEDLFWDLLGSYDSSGVLPPREVIEQTETSLWLVRAVLEVWRAARPLADIARAALTETPEPPANDTPLPTSSLLPNMDGPLVRSSAS